MKKYIIPVLTVILFTAFLQACSENGSEPKVTESPAQVTMITVEQLSRQLENKDFTLINVHIPYAGEIPSTDLFIPFNALEDYLDKLPSDKNTKIVVYCRSGSMSASASQELLDRDYAKVYDVTGGMNAWVRQGFELLQSK